MRTGPGLYVNDRGDDGSTNETLWTYNSGAMIGTATALYRGTGDAGYLAKAVEDARASLAYWAQGTRLHDQPAIFNAFYFKDLLDLDAVRPDAAYLRAMSGYADNTYADQPGRRHRAVPLPAVERRRLRPAAPAATLNQSAMVQIFATLAHATRRAPPPTGRTSGHRVTP